MGMRLLLLLSASLRECASPILSAIYRALLRLPVSKGGAPCASGSTPLRTAGGPLSFPGEGAPRSPAPAQPSPRPARVVESLWSASFPLTRARQGGNVSPCR